MLRLILCATALFVMGFHTADARPKRTSTQQITTYVQPEQYFASRQSAGPTPTTNSPSRITRSAHRISGTAVGGRPAGCPKRHCGCSASLYLFGKIIPKLNLAWNWVKMFPKTQPAPGMVAARRGHVFVLKHHIEGKVWMAYDANSGGGKTRIHPRSIAGFTIVNPHSRMAGL